MYNYAESSSNAFLSYIFFVVLIFIGAFFTMNLLLANILDAFNYQQLKNAKD